jgi:hypothetical protein
MATSWFFGLTIAVSLSALAAAVRVSTPSYRGFVGFFHMKYVERLQTG